MDKPDILVLDYSRLDGLAGLPLVADTFQNSQILTLLHGWSFELSILNDVFLINSVTIWRLVNQHSWDNNEC